MGWMRAVPAKGVLQGDILIYWLSGAGEQHRRAHDTGLFPVFRETRQRSRIDHRID
jgi:hypothetical protein